MAWKTSDNSATAEVQTALASAIAADESGLNPCTAGLLDYIISGAVGGAFAHDAGGGEAEELPRRRSEPLHPGMSRRMRGEF